MTSLALDTYVDRVVKEAVKAVEDKRGEVIEPISWIKLQQGGQGDLWVSHLTVNSGLGSDRDPRREKHLELWVEGDFPSSVDELDDHPVLEAFFEERELDEDDIDTVTDVLCDALTRELLRAGARIRSELEARGFQVEPECAVCCGDEDNTWGWPDPDPDAYVDREVIASLGSDGVRAVAELLYATPAARAWLEALAAV